MKLFIGFWVIILTTGLLVFFSGCSSNHEGNDRSEKLIFGKNGVTRPDDASIQEFYMTYDHVEGRIPKERLKTAYLSRLLPVNSKLALDSIIDWQEVMSDHGGRTRAFAFDPSDTTGLKAWAGSATGGLWFNNNPAQPDSPWYCISDQWQGMAISSIVFDPLDHDIMYVGTGESQTALVTYRESSGLGVGIWKSTDGAATWTILPSTQGFAYISALAMRAEGGNSVLYAGVLSGVYQGTAHSSLPSDGLYRSTNGGQTWAQVLPNVSGTYSPFAVADIEIAANGKIFVGSSPNLNGDGGATILHSQSGLAGSWTVFDQYNTIIQSNPTYYLPGRVIVAPAPSDSNIIYALISAGYQSTNSHPYYRCPYIIKSTNGGVSWSQCNLPGTGPTWATLGWHALAAGVDPNNPNKIVVGGLNNHKSSDGGNSWTEITDWSLMYQGGGSQYTHADIHNIIFRSVSSNELFITSDGGVYFTNNANQIQPNFSECNKQFNTLQFYSCDIAADTNILHLLGGLQDNGTYYYDGSQNLSLNTLISGGDGAYCFFDDDQPGVFMTSVYYNYWYTFQNYSMHDYFNASSGLFVNPSDYSSLSNTIIANACNFFGSYSDMLFVIDGIPNINDYYVQVNTGTTDPFSTVKISPYCLPGAEVVYLGTSKGDLFRVDNIYSTATSNNIGSSNFPTGWISSIDFGGSEDTILVTFSNYGLQSVWITTDGGISWVDIQSNLPDMPVRWALFHPANTKQIMLATETGVWTTNDAFELTVQWTPDQRLPALRVDMLSIRDDDFMVVAATHGRGLFTGKWNIWVEDTGTINPGISQYETFKIKAKLIPNPVKQGEFFFIQGAGNSVKELLVFDLSGKLVKKIQNVSIQNGITSNDLSRGTYFIAFSENNKKRRLKLIVY